VGQVSSHSPSPCSPAAPCCAAAQASERKGGCTGWRAVVCLPRPVASQQCQKHSARCPPTPAHADKWRDAACTPFVLNRICSYGPFTCVTRAPSGARDVAPGVLPLTQAPRVLHGGPVQVSASSATDLWGVPLRAQPVLSFSVLLRGARAGPARASFCLD